MNEKMYWLWLSGIDNMWSKKMEILINRFGSAEEIYKASKKSIMAFYKDNNMEEINQSKSNSNNQNDTKYLINDFNKNVQYEYNKNGIKEIRKINGRKVDFSMEDVERILDKEYGKKKMEEMVKIMDKERMKFTYIGDENFPARLYDLSMPVYNLFYIGKLPSRNTCSIIGARNRSEYGKKYALTVGENLARGNVEVISGMARGIDTYGMYGAYRGGASVYAVLGSGADVCYPKENFEIYEAIKERGGIISEYPPGCFGMPWHFPHRNRIISGLSDCVAVIEARKKSGSLITVSYAMQEGKDIYALPGRVSDELSVGCNELIRDGAAVIFDGREIVFDITGKQIRRRVSKKALRSELGDEKYRIYSVLSMTPESVENISIKADVSIDVIRSHLLDLELSGYIVEVTSGYYVRG